MNQTEPADRTPDWNEVWKERQRLHESVRIPDDPSHDWNRKENAERYAANARSGYDDRIQVTLAGLVINRASRVLDIGAGPGTLSIPLAPRVKEITAVEPGTGMATILETRAAAEGLMNISCIRKMWEEIDVARDLVPPYELVIASLSLTMEDIRAAILKMDAVSRGYVCLYWFVDMPFWERMYADLWEPLHGTRYYSGPKADCLFNVLYQQGIYANVECFPLKKEYRFASREEMNAFFIRRFDARSPAQQEIVRQYLSPLIRNDGPAYVISGDSVFAKIWWKKEKTGD